MFRAVPQKINLENFSDIQLRPCGTSNHSSEIIDSFVSVLVRLSLLVSLLPEYDRNGAPLPSSQDSAGHLRHQT